VTILFDVSAFFEYYQHMKLRHEVKMSFKEAMDGFHVKDAVEKVSQELKSPETVYVVPSVTGKSGLVDIGKKTFYEF
jgi:hypothetical protein